MDAPNPIADYKLTLDENNPYRVIRIELEFVDFTAKVTLQNGHTFVMTDPDCVQELLNEAHCFNASHLFPSGAEGQSIVDHNKLLLKQNGHMSVEIKLDPVNSVNTFHIPL